MFGSTDSICSYSNLVTIKITRNQISVTNTCDSCVSLNTLLIKDNKEFSLALFTRNKPTLYYASLYF